MALPAGIATKVVTLGKYYGADGTLSNNWAATVTIDRELRWVATGDVIEPTTMPITRDSLGNGSVRLPITDQSGFVDSAGSPVTGWFYTITISSPDFQRKPRTFQLPASATDPFDADNVPVQTYVPTIVPGGSYVTTVTVNGVTQTGAVVIDLGNNGGPIGSTTVAGITDATTIGQGLLRSADQNSALTVLGIASLPATSAQAASTANSATTAANAATAAANAATSAASTASTAAAAASTAAAAAAPKASPTFTGTVTVPIPAVAGAAATKGYVDSAIAGVTSGSTGLYGSVFPTTGLVDGLAFDYAP